MSWDVILTHQPVEARKPRDFDGMRFDEMMGGELASSRPCWADVGFGIVEAR
jgi:hypothetical protein